MPAVLLQLSLGMQPVVEIAATGASFLLPDQMGARGDFLRRRSRASAVGRGSCCGVFLSLHFACLSLSCVVCRLSCATVLVISRLLTAVWKWFLRRAHSGRRLWEARVPFCASSSKLHPFPIACSSCLSCQAHTCTLARHGAERYGPKGLDQADFEATRKRPAGWPARVWQCRP